MFEGPSPVTNVQVTQTHNSAKVKLTPPTEIDHSLKVLFKTTLCQTNDRLCREPRFIESVAATTVSLCSI